MIVLIPLGGLGLRFKNSGYNMPKPLINIMGKPILYWLLDNLDTNKIDLLIIPYNNNLLKYNFENKLKNDYRNINFFFYCLPHNTQGTAETILLTLNQLEKELNLQDQSILCLDGDNFYLENIITNFENIHNKNCIYVFEDNSNSQSFSYIQIDDENNQIIDIIEKNKISNLASTGANGFMSWMQLKYYCNYIISKNIKDVNEYYLSTVIKIMIKNNIKFITKNININNYICLGTPLHCRLFCNNFPVINALTHNSMLKTKRYCFDLDNTLVSYPDIKNDYSSVKPLQTNINYLKYLKKMGHTIIIYTARRMKTYNGNQGKLLADIGKITFETLDKFEIPYDEIYFGKPYADYYIDDLAIPSYNDLEKELGYYYNTIKPREYNNLSNPDIQSYRKTSNNLDGEIYYYQNIPIEIKDMFPIMLNYDDNNRWYDMEKINGIPISILYLAEELTLEQFDHIYNSINRIHNVKYDIKNNEINIYTNYIEKLKLRYKTYDYSSHKDCKIIYNNLLEYFKEYQIKNKGIKKVIHGDTVFTNILINQFGKIKFIDMRGKQGNQLSIYGDWLYDWAKLYQSLIGYDEILNNKIINIEYKNKFINHFKNKFIQEFNINNFNDLMMISKLLLFTLIPLHNNDKCDDYYKLISKI